MILQARNLDRQWESCLCFLTMSVGSEMRKMTSPRVCFWFCDRGLVPVVLFTLVWLELNGWTEEGIKEAKSHLCLTLLGAFQISKLSLLCDLLPGRPPGDRPLSVFLQMGKLSSQVQLPDFVQAKCLLGLDGEQ